MAKEIIMISLTPGLRGEVEKKIKPFGGKFSTYLEELIKKDLGKKEK